MYERVSELKPKENSSQEVENTNTLIGMPQNTVASPKQIMAITQGGYVQSTLIKP